ncbi:MAG: Mfa1 family fimbria major subunit [Rikenellaceae bacterium]
MKKITMTFALIVIAAMMAQSCQKEDLAGSSDVDQDFDAAYISLTIDSPSTRAATSEDDDGKTEDGSGDENKIYSIALLAFDINYDYIAAYQEYVSDDGTTFNCEVAPDARRFFAVVNPTAEIWAKINEVASLSQSSFSNLPAIELTAASVSTENYIGNNSANENRGFTMVNCGSKNTSGILLESLVTTDVLSDDEEYPTKLTISVDRLVSKFNYSVSNAFNVNEGNGSVLGVALTATNKASYLYSMILTDALDGGNVYRTDHNMAVGQGILSDADAVRDELELNFNWLKNGVSATDAAFYDPGVVEYVLENTCEPAYSNSNNLTQAIVKAKYNPLMTNGSTLDIGVSWFKMYTSSDDGTLYLTFDEVVNLYKGTTSSHYSFTAGDETKASMDVQLNKIMGTTGKTWADSDVTLTALDKCAYGGYNAATVAKETDYVLQYYQNAINYYDIFIQHDDSQDIGHAGRWGMVRNNSYTMDITGISGEGLPYIPDPTDPEIVDPENQDPSDPEPADKLNAFITVSISVNPWVMWYQSSTLE